MQKRMWQTVGGGAIAAMCGILAVAVTAPVGVTANPARTYTYVAAGFHVIGPDLAAAAVADATGVRTAPLGWVGMVPDSDRFHLRIEDLNTLSENVAVTMVSSGDWRRDVCAPRGEDVLVDGVPVGRHVSLFVWDATPYHSWCPGTAATSGTLTITP